MLPAPLSHPSRVFASTALPTATLLQDLPCFESQVNDTFTTSNQVRQTGTEHEQKLREGKGWELEGRRETGGVQ